MKLRIGYLPLLLLILLTNGCGIQTVERTGAQSMQQPTVPSAAITLVADPPEGTSPLRVIFRVSNLPEVDCLNFRFDFGDGYGYATKMACVLAVVTPPAGQLGQGQGVSSPTAVAAVRAPQSVIPTPPLIQGTPPPRGIMSPPATVFDALGPPLMLTHTYRDPGTYIVRFVLTRFDHANGQEIVVGAANEVRVTGR